MIPNDQEQRIMVVCGAQFGSEGKGSVAAWLASYDQSITCVRVGGPNAGHTVQTPDGAKHKLQQIPTGIVHGNKCIIAAGSEIDLTVLQNEIHRLQESGFEVKDRLYVDLNATILTEEHSAAEMQGKPHGEAGLTNRVGSTGKGVGAARSDRIWRKAKTVRDLVGKKLTMVLGGCRVEVCDTTLELPIDIADGCSILIEGTQGYGLGLHTPYYPFTTSGDARAIDFLAQAGLCPWAYPELEMEIWLVARSFPIRVAGNSGPLLKETSWEAIGQMPEYTTVTNKMRRIGEWDPDLVIQAIANNGGNNGVKLVFSFLDYVYPSLNYEINKMKIYEVAGKYLTKIEDEIQTPITAVSTGPNTITRILQ